MEKLLDTLTIRDGITPLCFFILLNNLQGNFEYYYLFVLFNFIISYVGYFTLRLLMIRTKRISSDNLEHTYKNVSNINIIITDFLAICIFFILIDTFINRIVFDNIWQMLYMAFIKSIIPSIILISFEIFLKKRKNMQTTIL